MALLLPESGAFLCMYQCSIEESRSLWIEVRIRGGKEKDFVYTNADAGRKFNAAHFRPASSQNIINHPGLDKSPPSDVRESQPVHLVSASNRTCGQPLRSVDSLGIRNVVASPLIMRNSH
jgi:hypothetical protein